MTEEVEKRALVDLLEDAANEPDLDATGLAHNMYEATLEQLHEIVEFAERLKEGALIEMWLRERKATGQDARYLEEPPEGYTGYRPQD
ncbi:hypothetical protein ACF8GD_00230 [Pseudomonas putida]|uniref:hypothetical protein n=1 Tax=Pseudomonas putida TaxID=303 RepID=UPI00370B00C7